MDKDNKKKALHNIPEPDPDKMRFLYESTTSAGTPLESRTQKPLNSQTFKVDESKKSRPKYKQFRNFGALFSDKQIDILDGIEKEIMRSRVDKTERITKNSILRCLVELLPVITFDKKGISSEEELFERIKLFFQNKQNKGD